MIEKETIEEFITLWESVKKAIKNVCKAVVEAFRSILVPLFMNDKDFRRLVAFRNRVKTKRLKKKYDKKINNYIFRRLKYVTER